jgi:small multidrug resistance pump
MPHWLYLAIAIVAEVIGTTFLKSAEGFTRLAPSIMVIVSYLVAFFFLGLALRTLPVGIAYAIWAGVGVALIALSGYAFFGQRLDAPAIAGIALIVAGVVVINVFSNTVPGAGQAAGG